MLCVHKGADHTVRIKKCLAGKKRHENLILNCDMLHCHHKQMSTFDTFLVGEISTISRLMDEVAALRRTCKRYNTENRQTHYYTSAVPTQQVGPLNME